MPGIRMLSLMLLPATVVAVIVLVRGFDLSAVSGLRLRRAWLIWVAAAVQCWRTAGPDQVSWLPTTGRTGALPVVVLWGLAVAFLASNTRAAGRALGLPLAVLGIGLTSNALITVLRAGMPFSSAAARIAGFTDREIAVPVPGHPVLAPGDPLAALADVIPLPRLHLVLSPGDVLLLVGGTGILLAVIGLRGAPDRGGAGQPASRPPVRGVEEVSPTGEGGR